MMYLDLLPTQGRLTVFGKNVNQMSNTEIAFSRRRMGVVFQDFRLLNHLTVFDNVMLPLTLHGIPTKAQVDCVKEILDWVGLGDKHAVHPHSLSGGEQQRVAIARAVVNRPQVLIADEPTGNVDAAMGRRIFHLFCELHKHGTTVLVATHDDNLVRSYDYPCLYINHGRLIRRRDVRGAA
jgi:cell division transport system ATP-binding protein